MEIDSISYPQTPESCKFCICFDKVQLMNKLRPSPPDGFSVVYLQAGDCHMHLGAQCPVINELRFYVSAFTSHLLCRLSGRLLFKQKSLFGQEVIYVTDLADQPGANI